MSHADLTRAMRLLNRRQPFRPYILEFASGDRITIANPEFAAPFGSLFLFATPDRHQRFFDAESVTQVIDAPAPQPGS